MGTAFLTFWHWLSGRARFEREARLIALEKAHALLMADHLETDLARAMVAADSFYRFLRDSAPGPVGVNIKPACPPSAIGFNAGGAA